MERYRAYGQEDDQPLVVGDEHFLGVDEYNNPENVQPAYVQKAVNCSFSTMNAETRGGFVCLPELGAGPFGAKWYGVNKTLTGTWNCITYGKNFFCAGGKYLSGGIYYPCVMVSVNGTDWTQISLSASSDVIWSIAYANGVFVAGGVYKIYYSSDGLTWTASASSPPQQVRGLAYGNGRWACICNGVGGFSNFFYPGYSTDNGVTWTFGSDLYSTLGPGTDLTFWNGKFIAITQTGNVATSTNGVTYSSPVFVQDQLVAIAFGNNAFCALRSDGTVWRSIDLTNWTKVRTGVAGYGYDDLDFYNGRFIAIGISASSVMAMSSIDGTAWLQYNTGISTSSIDLPVQCLANGNNMSVVVNDSTGATYQAIYSYNAPVQNVYASGLYSDPQEIGLSWVMLLGGNSVGFYSFGHNSRTVSLGSYNVTEQSTIVQANNYVYIFRGDNDTPLYWNGDWNSSFTAVPSTTLPATYNSIPNSNQATYYQNRLWVRNGKDSIAASDVLAFSDYDPLANSFNLNTGNSDYVVATFPFGQTSLVCFKNKSIQLMQQVDGALTDVIVTEITRQVGLVGINAVTSVGPDLAYVSYGNINLLTLTTTNNALQHKTLPLSSRIKRTMNRVNWNVGYKISLGYWNNKLYVALPLDNSQFCNAVVVYNFITESWYGEWSFSPDMNMCIQGWQVNDYLGLQRLHAITEDGRIFVTDEGQNDISGTTVSEISTELLTRAYNTAKVDNERRGMSINHFQRRMFADVSTNRPQFSVSSYTDGANEESVLLTDQTYSRSQSWRFADEAYDLINANDDYNRAYRRDYSTGPNSVQCGTGFQPEMPQDIRIPMITQRHGRLSWLKLTNTQGYLMLKSIGFENRAGQRGSVITA